MNNADKLAALAEQAKAREINALNASKQKAFQETNSMLFITQEANKKAIQEASDELERVYADTMREGALEVQAGGAKIAMSEGVTAGASKGYSMMTFALQSSKKLGQVQQKGESVLNKLYMQAEQDNIAIENRKVQSINDLRSGLISGDIAALQIKAAGQQGRSVGEQQDRALEQKLETQNYLQELTEKTAALQAINRTQAEKLQAARDALPKN